jgi:uncharacterized metal-binding protein (TIGR02443 family)
MEFLAPKMQKRFIAGAACPKCRAVDKIFTLTGGEGISRNCADCGFSEQLVDHLVDQEAVEVVDANIQVLELPQPK